MIDSIEDLTIYISSIVWYNIYIEWKQGPNYEIAKEWIMKLNYDQKVYAARVELDSLGVDIYKLGAEICQSLSLLEAEIRIAKKAK